MSRIPANKKEGGVTKGSEKKEAKKTKYQKSPRFNYLTLIYDN